MVLPAGATQWAPLGQLAGLDAPAPTPQPAAPPPAPASMTPHSLRPVSANVDLDEELRTMNKSSKVPFVLMGGAAAALVIGSIVFAASTAASSSGTKSAVAPATTVAPPKPAAPPTPPPEETSTAPKLTEEQKKALAEKDKQLEAKLKAKASDRSKDRAVAAGKSRKSDYKSGPVFTTGGAKGDPLSTNIGN
jgi:hypothetical protein